MTIQKQGGANGMGVVQTAAAGRVVRALRGERTRAEFICYVYNATGIFIPDASLYRIEAGKVRRFVPAEVEGLILAYPSLARVFFGANLHKSIVGEAGTVPEDTAPGAA